MYGETLDFQCQHKHGSKEGFNGTFTGKKKKKKKRFSNRAFYVTTADVDIGSLKSLCTLFDKVFGPHAFEIWTKLYGPNHTIFCNFWQEMVNNFWQSVWLTIFDKVLMQFWQTLVLTETIVWY